LPASVHLQGLTLIPQKFNNCGPTNLAINLNYYGRETDQLDVAGIIKPNDDDRNVSPDDLAYYVRNHTDMAVTVHVGSDLEMLKRLLAAGYPVIIEKGLIPNEQDGWMGHYLTLIGYDDARQQFVSLDTFLGPWDSSGLRVSYEETNTFWQHFNYTFLVVYPQEEETAVQQLLGPTLLDPLAMWQNAAEQAQRDITQNADNAFAWFNLGSSLTQLGHLTGESPFFDNAAAAYDQARSLGLPWRMLWYQFGPYEAYLASDRTDDIFALTEAMFTSFGGQNVEETYYYRGQAKLALGDSAGATADFQTALQLNPNYIAAQAALDS
jgi:tetratricopeptide (TPR) repeat protein